MIFGFKSLATCCLFLQLVLDHSLSNIYLAVVLVSICFLSIQFCQVRIQRQLSVVPTLMMGFFAVEFAFLPLLLKTLDLQAVVERLNYSNVSATVVLLTGFSIFLGGMLFDYLRRDVTSSSYAYRFGFLDALSFRQYMAMGFVSMGLWLFSVSIGGIVSKVLFPVSVLIILPFACLANENVLYELKFGRLYLFIYFVFLVFLSAAFNARGIAAEALVVAVVSWLVGQINRPRPFVLHNMLLVLIIGMLSFVFFERFVLAMGVAREARGVLSTVDMIHSTLRIFVDDDRLREYSQFTFERSIYGGYSESYVDSTLLSRFVGIKFLDNFLFYASLLPDGSASLLADERMNGVARLLPGPFASLFGVHVDKGDIYSVGDYLYYLYSGVGLGEWKTGSFIGDLWLIVGRWLYLPMAVLVVVLLCAPISVFLEGPGTIISPLLLVLSWKLFGTTAAVGLAGDSVVSMLSFLLRNYWQFLGAYLMVKYIGRLLVDRGVVSVVITRS